MHSRYLVLFVLPFLGCPQRATAQETRPTFRPTAEDLRTPIRAEPTDDGRGGGTWASGATFKASVHDGFTFHPVLGREYPESRPFGWRTVSARVGPVDLPLAGSVSARTSDWRCEYDLGSLVEAYDVLADGVEQTFVLDALPARAGDLVIRGRCASDLRAEVGGPAHRPLVFRDDAGQAIVEYGSARAIDATGRTTPVDSSYDGAHVELRVPSAWLATAVLPVTVDPLVASRFIDYARASSPVTSIDIGVQSESLARNVLIAFTRAVSATDEDVFAVMCDRDYGNRTTVFRDSAGALSDRKVTVAYVAGPDRWMVGFERWFASSTGLWSTIRVYYHDRTSLTLNSGNAFSITAIAAESYTNPDLGGSQPTFGGNADHGVLVYRRDLTSSRQNTANSEVVIVRINARTQQFLSAVVAGNTPVGSALDRELPSVNQVAANGADGWLVVWQELDRRIPLDDWDLYGTRVDGQANKLASGLLVSGGLRHLVAPRVAGEGGRYAVSTAVVENLVGLFPSRIEAARVDWSSGAGAPTVGPLRTLSSLSSTGFVTNGQIAFDSSTDSHWAATFTVTRLVSGTTYQTNSYVARLGQTAAMTEYVVLPLASGTNTDHPAVAFDPVARQFPVAWTHDYCVRTNCHTVLADQFVYPSDAQNLVYGVGCSAASISASDPYAGNGSFAVSLAGAPASTAAWLVVGLGTGNLPLSPAGMTGCYLNLDPSRIVGALPVSTSGAGAARVPVPLPDVPLFTGDLYFQWSFIDPGANPANFSTGRALRSRVR